MLELIQSLIQKLNKLFFLICYSNSFKQFGKKSTLSFPFQVDGAKYISVGNQVYIHKGAWLLALKNQKEAPKLIISNKTYIGRFFHLVCVQKINICKNVLISDKVYISDNLHDYKDITIPIKDQMILSTGGVSIGENSWIGENVCIIGASVGKHCVIGANSVVVRDIPDYSIAVGSPAKVIKRFNTTNNSWERVNN